MQRILFLAVPALLALLSGWLVYETKISLVGGSGPGSHDPDMFIEDFTVTTMNDNGIPRYRLQAERMTHYPHNDSSELETPYLEFYQPGKPSWHIQSAHGRVTSGGAEVRLLGNVRIRRIATENSPEVTILTRNLRVRPEEKTASTTQQVDFSSPGYTVQAVGMQADLGKHRLQLLSHVKGSMESHP